MLDGLLPGQCEVCRDWGSGGLCRRCVARFAAPRPRCRRCALPLATGAALCGECLRDPPAFEHTACIADYGFPWDRLIVDFKFHGRPELSRLLAPLLADATTATPPPDWVVPVPLAPRRLAERGYNQAWELARRIARQRRLRASAALLARPLDTAPQAELSRAQRLANLRAAFFVEPRQRERLRGKRVALVDDVLTTGATARAASRALLQAGAAAVDLWVVARTPDR